MRIASVENIEYDVSRGEDAFEHFVICAAGGFM